MNHKPKKTPSSYIAGLWFANYVKEKVIDAGQSEKLAKAIGMERKQIYKYASGEASPKLEVVANILAYFGDFDKVREAIGGTEFLKTEEGGAE